MWLLFESSNFDSSVWAGHWLHGILDPATIGTLNNQKSMVVNALSGMILLLSQFESSLVLIKRYETIRINAMEAL